VYKEFMATKEKLPFGFSHHYTFGDPSPGLAVLEVGDGYFCLEHLVGYGHLALLTVKKAWFAGSQYVTQPHVDVQERVAATKAKALTHGATLEAIQLLGTLTSLTPDEEKTMAEANTKLSRKDELKKAAKETPVAGKKAAAPKLAAPARKGNPDALAKARAARAAPAVNKPYKVLVKTNPGREGTWTHAMVEHIIGATSTDDAKASLAADKENKHRKLDFSWAAAKGIIKI
jgi:hypothetical protein